MQKQLDLLNKASAEALSPDVQDLFQTIPGVTVRMAITIVSILSLLLCYPLFQKYFIKGLAIGSVKG